MFSFGNDGGEPASIDNSPDTDFCCTETQPFDSQFSPSVLTGENDENYGNGYDLCHLNTAPLEYNFDAEDDTGTEVVNLIGKTQERDLAGETQLIDLAGETQVWDDFEVDTQLLDDDGGRTDKTEILASANELSGDNSRRNCDQVIAGNNSQFETEYNKQSTSSHVAPRFTYIRTESLRQAALARRMVMNVINGETCTLTNTSHSSDKKTMTNNESTFAGDINEAKIAQREICNQIKCRTHCSTARKLCFESRSGNKEPFHKSKEDDVEELHKFPASDGELTGLSYVDSQEPQDLAQANALDFVERFLQDIVTEFDVDFGTGKNAAGESKLTPASKGQRDLAKRACKRKEICGVGVFDWDDNREDEGGGDIFVRRKEEFFGSDNCRRKSFSFPQRTKAARSNQLRDEEQENTFKKNNLLHSDSRVTLHNLKGNDLMLEAGSVKLKRSLVNELDQPDGIDSSIHLEGSEAVRNVQDLLNVGPNTQIASEAMEALFNGEGMASNGTNYTDQILKNNLEDHPKSCPVRKTKNLAGCRNLRSKRNLNSRGRKKGDEAHPENILGRMAVASKRNPTKKQDELSRHDRSSEGKLTRKRCLLRNVGEHSPIAYRTRRSSVGGKLADTDSRQERKRKRRIDSIEERENNVKAVQPIQRLANEFSEGKKTKMGQLEQSDPKASAKSSHDRADSLICPRRSKRIRLGNVRGPGKLYDSSTQSRGSKDVGRSAPTSKRKWTETRSTCLGLRRSCRTRASAREYQENDNFCDATDKDRNLSLNTKSHADCLQSERNSKLITRSNKMQGETYDSSDLVSGSAATCKTHINDASPVCKGNDYHKWSCKANPARSALLKELRSLIATSEPLTPTKDSRKRWDKTGVRILFSHHLDDDIIKHQKKILVRIGSSSASSITDATHFVADQFVRTRNMLEAIASGKPVVTHLWLENCGQARCIIDERNYILRDKKMEKELGFTMPVSLARAAKHPLLEGCRVLITPNTKPSKKIISSLVKAVHGQAVERVGRSSVNDGKIPVDLLILSCEEDFNTCVPFLRKGGAVYSSELLLNGIVTQKLEYERYLLFADHVKRNRSTIWLREDGHSFQPVTKCK